LPVIGTKLTQAFQLVENLKVEAQKSAQKAHEQAMAILNPAKEETEKKVDQVFIASINLKETSLEPEVKVEKISVEPEKESIKNQEAVLKKTVEVAQDAFKEMQQPPEPAPPSNMRIFKGRDIEVIRFSQDSVANTFQDGSSVVDVAEDFLLNQVPEDWQTIQVVSMAKTEQGEVLTSFDNRRLTAARQLPLPIDDFLSKHLVSLKN
jgi:hypothetical protein